MIEKVQEENLAECLESVKWADEIIVVDDESTDKTREIALKYTDKVFVRKMENEGRHRNWAYQQARNNWVLSIDDDERTTEELKEEIIELLKNNPEFKAYAIPRRNYIGDHWLKYGGEYPAPQTRLFLKDEFKYEEAEVHHKKPLSLGGSEDLDNLFMLCDECHNKISKFQRKQQVELSKILFEKFNNLSSTDFEGERKLIEEANELQGN